MNGTTTVKNSVEEIFFLTDLLGESAYFNGWKVGKLKDIVALDQGKVAEVTHFQIARPFGEAPLLVPFPKVRSFSPREIIVSNGDPGSYVRELSPKEVPLRDYLIDKKVLDTEDREVEVVYDIRLSERTAIFMSAALTSAATACSARSGFEVWPIIFTDELMKPRRS